MPKHAGGDRGIKVLYLAPAQVLVASLPEPKRWIYSQYGRSAPL